MFFFDSLLFRREKSAFVPADEMWRVRIIDNLIDTESVQRGSSDPILNEFHHLNIDSNKRDSNL